MRLWLQLEDCKNVQIQENYNIESELAKSNKEVSPEYSVVSYTPNLIINIYNDLIFRELPINLKRDPEIIQY